MVHQENIEHYHEHAPRKLRKYLIDTGDERLLIQLDKMNMQSGSGKKPT